MRYKIKITNHANGSQLFTPYFKKRFGWKGISYTGAETPFPNEYESREDAMKRIDLHFSGNRKVTSIEFEYITLR